MIKDVAEDRVENIINKLVSFHTRHTLSTQNSTTRGIGAARDWIYKEMQASAEPSEGRTKVYFNSYIQDVDGSRILFPVNITNVVAQIDGTDDSNRLYVVTGHYDSRALDALDYESYAPGADDDASSVAVVMEMARICATKKPKATMIFAAVAGEEQGLYGSANLAKTLKQANLNVAGNWNNDIVGTRKGQPFAPINDYTIRLFGASIFYPNASTSTLQRSIARIGGWNDSPAQNLGRYIAEIAAGAAKYVGMQVKLIYRPDRFTEALEDFTHQHQDPRVQDGHQYGDLIEYVDFDYTARVAKVNLASMWSAANAPAAPTNVTIITEIGSGASSLDEPLDLSSNDSLFSWNASNDTLTASHELVWRSSGALQWTHQLAVDGSSVRVPLSKDNYQFGVRAVGKDGRKSPAVFPLPA
ncbi:putative zinc metalloprotease [Fulvia fulva]|uniref:Peptide hydrolase n=1 Tax=Passalora fulva TaxID=5499 RepID=A0A9Q8P9X0_PASFU|nr:putative zinc metalloprotease [Fulvia fulva]KAK4621587.1 putative zinc metalloprotease [Fulvia fulva]KAK4622664.1 putative zinc metalloprotease [Fulvia fulva]UJO18576.1 putative zinc metalloprotease [Fulvia fulva]WPV16395.1 putative zinc metalloprotease [Fulvia fulva]WPV31645.1 putative zinc metalloprotease [Fulvia fulva]